MRALIDLGSQRPCDICGVHEVHAERGKLDRREDRLALSAAGQAVLAEIREASAARFRELLARIPPSKRAQVLEALDLLTAALEPREEAA